MAKITDAMLKEWEGLCERATPGEWRSMRNGNSFDGKTICGSSRIEELPRTFHEEGLWYMSHSHVPTFRDDDADFIAAARTALPLLLAEVRRLRHGG